MMKKLLKASYIALPFAMVAVLATGCQQGGENEQAAAPPGGAATASPSASTPPPSPTAAPNTKEVCNAVLQAFLGGSNKIVDDMNKAVEQGWSISQQAKSIKATLAETAKKIEPQAGKANDPEIKAVIEEIASGIEKGAKSADPHKFLDKDFVGIGGKIDKECVAAG